MKKYEACWNVMTKSLARGVIEAEDEHKASVYLNMLQVMQKVENGVDERMVHGEYQDEVATTDLERG